MIGAGAVVTRNVADFALVLGNPARRAGWICQCGTRLPNGPGSIQCSARGAGYEIGAAECRSK